MKQHPPTKMPPFFTDEVQEAFNCPSELYTIIPQWKEVLTPRNINNKTKLVMILHYETLILFALKP
jgi:hypothetical protein